MFDRTFTLDPSTATVNETFQWTIDGVDFELTVRDDQLIRSPGRATRPAVTFTTSNVAFASILTGNSTVAEAVEAGDARLKGSRPAIRRMFRVLGFPFVRVGY